MQKLEYINIEKMQAILLDILTTSRDGMIDEESRDIIMDEYSDDYLQERAWEMAAKFNDDMKKYLHLSDHSIIGNFNNIDYDYPHHIHGEVNYDYPLVNEMISRLDAGEESKQVQADRDWLVDWFFQTFGTWAIGYNFECEISEVLYYELKNN